MLQNRKVNLFIVGAPKCGTTAWVEYLGAHPDIQFCREKEPHYFSADFTRFRWARSLEKYHSLFDNAHAETKIIGEGSVMYLYSSVAAQNIRDYNQDAKILIFLRSYTSFLRSYHRQLINLLDEDVEDFTSAWNRQDERRQGKGIPKDCREPLFLQYKDVASFGHQIERYVKVFPAEHLKIVCFDDWVKAPRETYIDILKFLGLEDDGRQDFQKINEAKQQRIRSLARLTRRPPRLLLSVASVLKKIAGINRLNWAKRLKVLNEKANTYESIDDELREDIRIAMHADAKKLKEFIDWNPFGC